VKRVFNPINVFLMIALVGLSTIKAHGNIFEGIGYALGTFVIAGVLFGVVVLGLYQFVRNVANPKNEFKPELSHRITATLVGGLLALLII